MAEINDIYKAFCDSTGISTDSRNCPDEAMFVALKGENFDGNKYVEEVLLKGAKYAITNNPNLAHLKNVFIVEDTLKTLQELAQFHRRQLSFPIISITGTNGKTTTKELINAVLSEKFKTKATKGNFNNHIGVPLTLLSFTKEMAMGIVEMGANHIGEIGLLCAIAEPDYCIITNVGKAHLEGFGSFEGVKKAKGEMYDYAAKNDKLIFINHENSHLQEMATQNKLRFEFGRKTDIEVQLTNAAPFVKINWTDKQLNKEYNTSTNLIGAYNLENINAAIAIGRYFNISPEAINHAISSYQPTNNRSQFINSKNNRIIMDAYNANPSSMAVALDNFNQIQENKKWIILGGMKELGNDSLSEHKKLIKTIDDCEFSKVLLIGDEFSGINGSYNHFSNNNDCINFIKQNPPKEAYILIKGSRSNKLEELLPFL
ncbi:UDP-N-acetylmuramoyl-tripeptide--D-alanyl-D-alanine ligase [Carboxylicivirga linearis]|uniref:UDP-N-acetylmuramoyl-tripeptide--D-alanyl-D-alanine ligase n=1 Tax=Carboxylicivirga linearis TaxID=1628157 RepID=A0ABS5JY23_9BACT|nr:UDP-N-acetylmuramoyl-tripeptide--D-alanyl-D-alanine ligase [Carboxylicivirga linearis]MBS2099771.1 UDP-N-acetylmuramoyl-tripeptide--D-alanyl-D-alanine ligase [Carboxylicivirga linearis]